MKEKNVTILELAKMTNLSSKTIDRARGPLINECRLSTLATIAAALGVPVKELFEEVKAVGE